MTDGLKDAHREAIVAVIAANDRVERAVLFGSRATGTNTVSSDVDIALVGDRLTLSDQARLSAALDEVPMAQTVDLLLYASIKNPTLLAHIGRDGIELYRRPNRLYDGCPQGIDDCRSEEWTERAFDEVIDFREGPGILARDFREEGVPLVRLAGLDRGASILRGCDYLSPEAVERRWTQFRLAPGDVLLSTSAALGRIAVVGPEGIGAIPYTGIIRMRPRDGSLYAPFIRYLLEGPDFQRQADMVGVGSVIRHFGPTHLRQMTIPVPPLSEQRVIAHILGTLDDKIELNRRMNATLEAMSRALFRSWFVDFDPVRAKMAGRDTGLPKDIADLFPDRLVDSELGEIPEGWTVSEIGAEVDVLGGATPSTKEPAYWNGGQHHWATPKDLSKLVSRVLLETDRKITDAGVQRISSGLLPVGTVLLSSRAPIGYLAIAEVPTAINQGFIAMTCRKQLPALYVLLWCHENLEHIKDISGGSTFAEISKKVFRPLPVVVPPERILGVYDGASRSLHDRVVANTRESALLVSVRDSLLPKLVSGELRVTAAEPASAHDDRPAAVATHEA